MGNSWFSIFTVNPISHQLSRLENWYAAFNEVLTTILIWRVFTIHLHTFNAAKRQDVPFEGMSFSLHIDDCFGILKSFPVFIVLQFKWRSTFISNIMLLWMEVLFCLWTKKLNGPTSVICQSGKSFLSFFFFLNTTWHGVGCCVFECSACSASFA